MHRSIYSGLILVSTFALGFPQVSCRSVPESQNSLKDDTLLPSQTIGGDVISIEFGGCGEKAAECPSSANNPLSCDVSISSHILTDSPYRSIGVTPTEGENACQLAMRLREQLCSQNIETRGLKAGCPLVGASGIPSEPRPRGPNEPERPPHEVPASRCTDFSGAYSGTCVGAQPGATQFTLKQDACATAAFAGEALVLPIDRGLQTGADHAQAVATWDRDHFPSADHLFMRVYRVVARAKQETEYVFSLGAQGAVAKRTTVRYPDPNTIDENVLEQCTFARVSGVKP